jgi:hypothetical protein
MFGLKNRSVHTAKISFRSKVSSLRQVAREVVFLSLNASVASYKVENGGETFAILAVMPYQCERE